MTRSRAAGGALVSVLAVATGLVVGAAPAWADHAEVIAAADCTGTVAYAVTSWAGRPDTPDAPNAYERSRTNPDIELQVSFDDRPFRTAVPNLALTKENRYTSTGTFELPEDEPLPRTVVLRTVPRAPFDSGAPGRPRSSPVLDLSRCESASDVDRRPLWLGGGAVGALAAWFLTRPRRGAT